MLKSNPRKRNSFGLGQRGMSLIEVMLTMVVLGVGILGLAPLARISVTAMSHSGSVTQIMEEAQKRVEERLGQGTISPIPFNSTELIGTKYQVNTNITDQSVDPTIPAGLYQIKVSATWKDPDGSDHEISLLTYKQIP